MIYKTYIAMFLVSALGAYFLTPFAAWLAQRFGAIDLPGPRKLHARPMPRMGGVAVYLGFLLPWAGLYLQHNLITIEFQQSEKQFLALVLGATAMLTLGVYDDIKGADAIKKLLAQTLIALGMWMANYRITALQNPWGTYFELGWLGLPITLLWIVGITNAINLLDGIDGLVTGVTAFMAISLAIINIITGHAVVALLTTALAGACFGFLPYNHAPARIFLGDSGSLTIGLVLACIGISSFFQDPRHAVSPLISVPLILFSLPVFDTCRVMFKRWRRGVSIFQADKGHVHHRLLELGFNHRQAAWFLYLVVCSTGAAAITLVIVGTHRQLPFSVVFCVLGIVAGVVWKRWARAQDPSSQSQEPPPNPASGPTK
jgi:UDP-GlcNAc:undecaprenyl-phosphate GlcNAc-1-phosphate transferase